MSPRHLALVRLLAVFVVAFGLVYLGWRWSSTIPWSAWWIGVPLVIAETYSLGESVLYALTMWNAKRRPSAPAALPGRTVDVFITTYNEPLELVLNTAIHARDLTYPHETWILDDGDRPEFRRAAEEIGVGYITRGPEWHGRQRFAKAGNINNALYSTAGEFIAILDADQVPETRFLDRVLGYFDDEAVAFVQTPQSFWNVDRADPLGSGAELFYGPIQQGKDGWGAAFFCGSNAVLRREAIMALGLTRFSRSARGRMRQALRQARSRLTDLQSRLALRDPAQLPILDRALAALAIAERQHRTGEVLSEISWELQRGIRSAVIDGDEEASAAVIGELDAAVESVEVARTDQALAVHALDTSSITEDMATAMHLHAMGWTSVYHHEVLVHGLAPEDVRTMLTQRKRWASGSMQVFFAENPLFLKGLSLAQRFMYLATMTSYLNGFAALVYIAAPIVFLTTGIFPLAADASVFLLYFVPMFLTCQLLFQAAGRGSSGLWRGQQMSFALFPTWISATLSGAAASLLGKHLSFSVTAKSKQGDGGADYRAIWPQLLAIGLLAVAAGIGIVRAATGDAPLIATLLTLLWVALDFVLIGSMVRAARYRGPSSDVVDPLPPTDEHRRVLALLAKESAARAEARRPDSPASLPASD
ncbi:glycosyltransferase [Schumannella sp. 10F1B-5-1]|uniref:glycosyltransferase family 2 protein n=1 Tax=Schumannella sp. 10F1B-5-1 TaxID=2590780 RepID=UPI0011313E66|nr:glycosyltransferase [Schumannella sp. 10F1B-5-1]TPW70174.1 glycosyltransferase [Schumannella sp. 10F1B-5-1]